MIESHEGGSGGGDSRHVVTESHEGGSGGSGSRHVCIIAVFLLVRLLYLLIHSLDYLFRSIQTLTVLTDFIDLVVVPSLIACCLSNSSPKLTSSQCVYNSSILAS